MCLEKLKLLTTKEGWLRPPSPNVGCCFWIMFIVGFGTFVGTFVMNIIALNQYAKTAEWVFFSILLVAIILPQVPINWFSFWWFRTDSENRRVSWKRTIAHYLLFALPLRMCKMGFLAKRTTSGRAIEYHTFYLAQADLSFLRLIGVYTGSAPQLVVRVYKLLKNWSTLESIISEIIFGSLAALSLVCSTISMARHSRSHRYDKQELSYASIILQVLYRVCFLASRIMALSCLFSLGVTPALVTCAIVFVVCFIWFHCMETDLTENDEQECFFHALMAFLHIFGMFNVKDDPAKYRYAFYYSLGFVCEVFVFISFITINDGMYWLSVFPCVFLIGLACHCVEHEYFHPGGRLYIEREPAEWEGQCEECAADRELANFDRNVGADPV